MSVQPVCDRGMALGVKCGHPGRPRLILTTCILASSLAFIDGSVVNVGLPAIGRDLHGSASDLQWVINAYLLPLSALLLLGGALGDRFGRRRVLILGMALFALASAGCAAAVRLEWVFAMRGLQGLGAALLLPNSLAILGGAFEGEARGKAVGLWASASAIAGAVGPVLGGWLIDTVGWRAIFLINLPLAAGAIGLALYAVPAQHPDRGGARLDVIGGALATASLASVTWGLTVASGEKRWSGPALLATAAGIVLAAAFVWQERRLGDKAMTPLALFGSRRLAGLNLLTLLLYGALAGFLLLLPYRLIEASGYSATAAAASLLPFPVIMGLGAPIVGSVAGKIGARAPLVVGSVLVAAALALASIMAPSAPYWTSVLPAVTVMALGMTCAAAPLTSAVLSSVDARHTGSASGLNSALARAGGLLVIALMGAVLAARGQALMDAFRLAALTGAGLALAAGLAGLLLIGDDRPTQKA